MFEWQQHAACRGLHADFFFLPDETEHGVGFTAEIGTVKRMCAGCPVREDCLEHAIRHEEHGIWAGTTARERKGLRRERGLTLDRLELWRGEAA